MKLVPILLILGALAACNTVIPDGGVVVEQKVPTDTVATDTAEATTSDTTAVTGDTKPTDQPVEKVAAVVINNDNPAISNTQSFEALTKHVSIEDDKARLKAQREKFTIIAPKALPKRGSKTVNVVEYALKTKNAVGEVIYKRTTFFAGALNKRNCAKYSSPDDAQLDFLKSGGPKRDTKSLDPDGDGFACSWSPETYRKAAQ